MNITMTEDQPLTLQTRAALALNSTNTERDLIALAAKNAHIVAVIDKAGRQQAHGAAMELKTARTTIAKVSKEARDDATQFQRAIIAEEKRLIAIVEPEESRLMGLRDAYDDEQERIRLEAETKERARIAAIHERIGTIRGFLMLAGQCRTSDRIQALIQQVEAIHAEGFEAFDEFAAEASTIAATTWDAMVKLHASTLAAEEDRARLKAEQEAEAARLATERAAQAAAAAKLKAERDAFEAEQAAFKAQQAAAKARADADEREAREAQERAAYLDAINAAPVVDATIEAKPMTVREQFEKTFAVKEWAPTDMQILDALCIHFGKSERLVFDRLAKGFDLVALEAACFDEVAAA